MVGWGNQNFPEFGRGLATFAALAIPAATVNSGLKYMQTMIQLAFMKRLSHHLHNQYCNNRAYYSASQLKGVNERSAAWICDVFSPRPFSF